MDKGESGPGAQWVAPDLHDKMQKSRHIVLSFDGARRESGLGAAAWILWLITHINLERPQILRYRTRLHQPPEEAIQRPKSIYIA